MKRCEKDAIKDIKHICDLYGVSMLDMFKMFGIIDNDIMRVNHTIAKVRTLIKILLEKYRYWDHGLRKELEKKGLEKVR